MDGRTAAATLGVGPRATRDEIRQAFRARAKVVHPDAGSAGSTERFIALSQAIERLLAEAPADRACPSPPRRSSPFDSDAPRSGRRPTTIDLSDSARRPARSHRAGSAGQPVARDAKGLSFEDHLAAALANR